MCVPAIQTVGKRRTGGCKHFDPFRTESDLPEHQHFQVVQQVVADGGTGNASVVLSQVPFLNVHQFGLDGEKVVLTNRHVEANSGGEPPDGLYGLVFSASHLFKTLGGKGKTGFRKD
jgi:hypothetical protein